MRTSNHYPTGHKWADSLRNAYEITGVWLITGGYHYHLRINGERVTSLCGGPELVPHRDIERLMANDPTALETYVTNRPKSMADALKRNQARLGTLYITR
jgi:hypothetical protein